MATFGEATPFAAGLASDWNKTTHIDDNVNMSSNEEDNIHRNATTSDAGTSLLGSRIPYTWEPAGNYSAQGANHGGRRDDSVGQEAVGGLMSEDQSEIEVPHVRLTCPVGRQHRLTSHYTETEEEHPETQGR